MDKYQSPQILQTAILGTPDNLSGYYTDGAKVELGRNGLFVFGSNLAGRHGKGAALYAKLRYGAQYGIGRGVTGDSFAIPTKTGDLKVRTLEEIADEAVSLRLFAIGQWGLEKRDRQWLYLTPVGTGEAGYKPEEIAPLFKDIPYCWYPLSWKDYLCDKGFPGIEEDRLKKEYRSLYGKKRGDVDDVPEEGA